MRGIDTAEVIIIGQFGIQNMSVLRCLVLHLRMLGNLFDQAGARGKRLISRIMSNLPYYLWYSSTGTISHIQLEFYCLFSAGVRRSGSFHMVVFVSV